MKKYIILSTLFVLLTVLLISVQARTWKAGTFSVEGEYAGMTDDGTKVRIKKTSNGKHVKIALENLSKEDQDFIKSQNKRSGIENPFEDDEDEENADESATPVMEIPKENMYAFIVGVNVYADRKIYNLECCVSDATILAEKFKALGFPEKNITLLVDSVNVNEQPTKNNIESKLKQLTSELPQNSLIIFSFSGHGIELKGKGACFIPTDIKFSEILSLEDEEECLSQLASSVVSARDVSDWMENSKAQVKLMLVDACREKITGRTKGLRGFESINNIEAPKGFAVLQSCSYGECTLEDPTSSHHGYFTMTFLEALEGKADANNDGTVTLSEIFSYTSKETEMRVRKYEKGATQRPAFRFNGATIQDFPLVTGLLVDGLTKEQRDEAEKLYEEADEAFNNDNFQIAQDKINATLEIYKDNPKYQKRKKDIDKFVELYNSKTEEVNNAPTSLNSFVIKGHTLTKFIGKQTHVVIPDSITEIGEKAFSGCSSLKSVVIPDSVTQIGKWAFSNCGSLTSVVIPYSVTWIESGSFSDCSSLKNIQVSKNNPNYSSNGECLLSKDGKKLISCPSAFGNYTIPSTITTIGDSAFWGCSSLTSVVIPESVTEIGGNAFNYCSSLTSVVIPESVTRIGGSPFCGCSSLTSVVIPDSVTEIGEWAFLCCSSLKNIQVSKNNSKYSSNGECLLSKDGKELISCPSASGNYTIPSTIKTIRGSAFNCCSSLKSVVIPDSVTEIGEWAFSDCGSLTSVVIPESVTRIGGRPFRVCSSLKNIQVAKNNPKYSSNGECLLSKDGKELISCPSASGNYTIPSTITTIGDWAFDDCSSLTSVVIPDSVTEIGYSAFEDCPNLTIRTPKGSKAEKYAKENNIKFEELK